MLAPLVMLVAVVATRTKDATGGGFNVGRAVRLVPWFVWGFVILAAINTAGLLQAEFAFLGTDEGSAMTLSALLRLLGKILLAVALAAIGLEINVRALFSVGVRALGAGLVSTVILAAAAYGLIMALL
jgi:uncharacterized membrane protein YadS